MEDGKVSLDLKALSKELEGVCAELNLTADISEKKKKPEDDIPTVTTGKSQSFESMRKDKNAAVAETKKLKDELAAKDEEIAELKKKVSEGICASVLSDMDKKILIPASVVSEPAEVLAKDFFKDSPGADIDFVKFSSKSTEETEVDSPYERKVEPDKALTVRNVIRRVCSQFKDGRAFKSILNRQEPRQVVESQEDIERQKAIRLLLENNEMDNQTKLTTYALWYFHGDPEMEALLSYAGDYCIDANYLIQLLEQPKEYQNYRTIRSFLKQALSASEAHIKKQTVKELLCGDWQVVANYCGNPCHFRLVPVEEIQTFKELLLKNDQTGAACEACKMLKTTFGPVDQKLNGNHIADEKPQIESPGFLQEAYGDVDIHVQVDEDMVFDDFSEEEADGND
ncbi:hypothetical protein [[Clostridium] innocuum]|uniref:hypothetical protein n=1 Tax=Clostridium innocuum TaxID=1522 RepID=UPI003A4D7271